MGLKAAIGKSQKKDPKEAAQEALSQCLAQIPAQFAHLAIAFSAPWLAVSGALKIIKADLGPDMPLIGCCGARIISPEGSHDDGIVLALLSLPETKISCAAANLSQGKNPHLLGQELGMNLLLNVKGYHRETCLVLCDGLSENTSEIFHGLQDSLGRSFPFIGGGASDNFKFVQTFQYFNDNVLHKAVVAALFCGKFSYAIGIRHGWKPLGKIRIATESQGSIIKKIDGKKASSLYEEYFNKSLAQLKKEILYINTLYPIGLYLKGEDEYLLRASISIGEDGSIVTQGDVPRGSEIRLMIGAKESTLSAARQAAQQIKTAMRGKKIVFALVISSASRAYLLGRNIDAEIRAIKGVLGEDAPIVGFYSYGEYAPLGSISYHGQTRLHNQAIAILAIGE
jgi:hypothetical protein